jgi:hypothetical protein
MQTAFESFLETALNTATGFAISWLMTSWVLPLYGFPVTAGQGFQITCIFTVISILRSYVWRRYFNLRALRQSQWSTNTARSLQPLAERVRS